MAPKHLPQLVHLHPLHLLWLRRLQGQQRFVAQLQDGKTTSGAPTLTITSTNTVVSGQTSHTSQRRR